MKRNEIIKLLCSYGGKILPRSTDGKLRYVGGLTRVLSVDRSISFTELMVKLVEFCGYSVDLKCQLPNGDMETLISIKSEDDLVNLIEEYDRVSPDAKIRAVLSPPKSLKQVSPPPSANPSINMTVVDRQGITVPVPPPPPPPFGYPIGFPRHSYRGCHYPQHLERNYWNPNCNYH